MYINIEIKYLLLFAFWNSEQHRRHCFAATSSLLTLFVAEPKPNPNGDEIKSCKVLLTALSNEAARGDLRDHADYFADEPRFGVLFFATLLASWPFAGALVPLTISYDLHDLSLVYFEQSRRGSWLRRRMPYSTLSSFGPKFVVAHPLLVVCMLMMTSLGGLGEFYNT